MRIILKQKKCLVFASGRLAGQPLAAFEGHPQALPLGNSRQRQGLPASPTALAMQHAVI
jgi:hypothetical protein